MSTVLSSAAAERPADRRAAVTALFNAHHRSLIGLAVLMVGDRETAEDVVQEAFVSLYASWSRLRDPAAALSYLRSSTMNLARSRIRHRGVERRVAATLVQDDPHPSADTGAFERAMADEVLAALSRLPRRQREVLVLRYYEGLTELEIATTLEITTGSVKKHASRGLAALSRRFEVTS